MAKHRVAEPKVNNEKKKTILWLWKSTKRAEKTLKRNKKIPTPELELQKIIPALQQWLNY